MKPFLFFMLSVCFSLSCTFLSFADSAIHFTPHLTEKNTLTYGLILFGILLIVIVVSIILLRKISDSSQRYYEEDEDFDEADDDEYV